MDDDLGSLFFQPNNSDLFDLSGLFGGGDDWQPMDIDQISEDPWMSMVTPPDSTGLGGLTDLFNISNGGIAGMDPTQYAALFGGLANAARPPGATSGYAGNGQGGGSGGGGNPLGSLSSLGSLLPYLALLGGSLYGNSQTNKATDQAVGAINSASDQVKQILGGAQANYQPYMNAGTTALSKLANAAPSNIAGQFKPLGTGRGIR